MTVAGQPEVWPDRLAVVVMVVAEAHADAVIYVAGEPVYVSVEVEMRW